MGFSQENGYEPSSVQTIMTRIMEGINSSFNTNYVYDTFVGSNHYKSFYALAQDVQRGEVKTSEVFLKLQQYITVMNEQISRPVSTNPGLIAAFARAGYIASVKPTDAGGAGKNFTCVDVDNTADDYATKKIEICNLMSESIVGGIHTQGDQIENIVFDNGQSFPFGFFLPDRIEVLLRLTLTTSENNMQVILSPEDVKEKLMDNISLRYRLGRNFEPQRYFAQSDAPWTSQVKLEWSDDDGNNYYTSVFDAEFDELFDVKLENITVVEE